MEEDFVISFGKSRRPIKFKQPINEKSNNLDKSDRKKVNIVGNILSYNGHEVDVIVHKNNDIFWKASHVTKLIGYTNSEQTIRHLVSTENKMKYGELIKMGQLQCSGLEKKASDSKAIFINTCGGI